MLHNLLNEMGYDNTVERILSPHFGQELTPEIVSRLCRGLAHDNYLRRLKESRLTGEWIIFSTTKNEHHYLTLANHNEGDAVIAERVHHYEGIDEKISWRFDKATIDVGAN